MFEGLDVLGLVRRGEGSITNLFAASSKALDDFAVQFEWEWWLRAAVRTDDRIAGAVWTHGV